MKKAFFKIALRKGQRYRFGAIHPYILYQPSVSDYAHFATTLLSNPLRHSRQLRTGALRKAVELQTIVAAALAALASRVCV